MLNVRAPSFFMHQVQTFIFFDPDRFVGEIHGGLFGNGMMIFTAAAIDVIR